MRRGFGNNIIYDGESADLEDFLNAFGYDATMFGWSDEEQAKAIKFCLMDKALKEYRKLSDDDKKDINKIVQKLKETCTKTPEYYLNSFYTATLEQGESIAQFCQKLQKLLEKGLLGLQETHRDKMLKARLIVNVPQHVKDFLELMSNKKWSELVEIFEKSNDYKGEALNHYQTETAINKINFCKQPNYHQETKFNGTCNFCKKIGHKSIDCWHNKYDQNQQTCNRDRNNNEELGNNEYNQNKNKKFSARNNQIEQDPKYNNQVGNNRQNKTAFVIDVADDEQEVISTKTIDYHSLQMATKKTKHPLTRLNTILDIDNKPTPIKMLVDSGATA